MSNYLKDPVAVLDFATDWSAWLAQGETITAHTVTIDGPDTALVLDDHSATDSVVTAWLTGGTLGASYTVTYHVETNQGRTDERHDTVTVRDR